MKETLLANGISRLDKRIDVDELVSRLDKETRNKFLRKLGVDADQLVSKLPSNVIAEDLDFWIDLGAKTETILAQLSWEDLYASLDDLLRLGVSLVDVSTIFIKRVEELVREYPGCGLEEDLEGLYAIRAEIEKKEA